MFLKLSKKLFFSYFLRQKCTCTC